MKNLVTSLLLPIILISCSNHQNQIVREQHKLDSVLLDNTNTKNAYRFSYLLQLDTINPMVQVLDIGFDTSTLEIIFEKSSRLFFHYSDLHCSRCLEKQFQYLNRFEKSNGKESLCILSSVQSYWRIVSLISSYDFNCDILLIPDQRSIFMHHPFLQDPFYFTIKKDGSIDSFHLPLVNDSLTTAKYLYFCQLKHGSS